MLHRCDSFRIVCCCVAYPAVKVAGPQIRDHPGCTGTSRRNPDRHTPVVWEQTRKMESGGLGRLQAAFITGLHQGFDARQLKPRKDWATQDRQSFAHIPVADRFVAQPVANLRGSATSVNLVKVPTRPDRRPSGAYGRRRRVGPSCPSYSPGATSRPGPPRVSCAMQAVPSNAAMWHASRRPPPKHRARRRLGSA